MSSSMVLSRRMVSSKDEPALQEMLYNWGISDLSELATLSAFCVGARSTSASQDFVITMDVVKPNVHAETHTDFPAVSFKAFATEHANVYVLTDNSIYIQILRKD